MISNFEIHGKARFDGENLSTTGLPVFTHWMDIDVVGSAAPKAR